MALWECKRCGCRFAVGLRMCPQCTSESVREFTGEVEDVSPKISVSNGASYEGQEGGGDEWDGTNSPASTETPQTTDAPNAPSDPAVAPTTESPSPTDPTESGSADSTDGATPAVELPGPYSEWVNADLSAELERRGLAKTGTKAEMTARLEEDDAK